MSGGGDSVKKQKRLLAQLTAMLVMLGTMAALSRHFKVHELISSDDPKAAAGAAVPPGATDESAKPTAKPSPVSHHTTKPSPPASRRTGRSPGRAAAPSAHTTGSPARVTRRR